MGKTKDLFMKIGDTKGKIHTKINTIKDKNSKDLTEAEDIKKRWQEYTEELYKIALKRQAFWSLKSGRLIPPVLFFFLKIALAI